MNRKMIKGEINNNNRKEKWKKMKGPTINNYWNRLIRSLEIRNKTDEKKKKREKLKKRREIWRNNYWEGETGISGENEKWVCI